ncbi:hypothetical protein HW555_000395 [Spodoptera exigua]|uniref:Uncharacterized protein n=1 Tax=Spodoptera exigua TaxID=7107 RepID=A0A835GUY6_SPOEX|nr:hypothetical protein HW555_000395 [Spodoptera exigua]
MDMPIPWKENTQNSSISRTSLVMCRPVFRRGGSDLDPQGYRWMNGAGILLVSRTSLRSDPERISKVQGKPTSSRRDCQNTCILTIYRSAFTITYHFTTLLRVVVGGCHSLAHQRVTPSLSAPPALGAGCDHGDADHVGVTNVRLLSKVCMMYFLRYMDMRYLSMAACIANGVGRVRGTYLRAATLVCCDRRTIPTWRFSLQETVRSKISTPAGTTIGLKDSEWGQMGVTIMAGTEGWIILAPAATAYAVLPVGVDTIRPEEWKQELPLGNSITSSLPPMGDREGVSDSRQGHNN